MGEQTELLEFSPVRNSNQSNKRRVVWDYFLIARLGHRIRLMIMVILVMSLKNGILMVQNGDKLELPSAESTSKFICKEVTTFYDGVVAYRFVVDKLSKRYFLVENGYDPELGARPMRRLLQKEIEDPLSIQILTEQRESNEIVVDCTKDNKLRVRFAKKQTVPVKVKEAASQK